MEEKICKTPRTKRLEKILRLSKRCFWSRTTSYQVMGVPDGFAALKVVRTLVPHLVLLDYLLPSMDGLECLDMLRASKGMEQTPVILMSAGFPKGGEMRGHVQACSDLIFLEKPFEMDTLLTMIWQILEENETNASLSLFPPIDQISGKEA